MRTRAKLSRNPITGTSLLLLTAAFVFVYFFFGKIHSASASQIHILNSGNWNVNSTWIEGRVPASNDTLIIPIGKTIVITNSTAEYTSMKIIVQGTLRINSGKKLLICNSLIDVAAGGVLTGDNAGSMVDLCGISVWNGSMSGNGPFQIGATVLPVILSSFKAESATNGTVNLSWETASEVNCDYFSVERSSDGSSFEVLTQIQGAGNTNTSQMYSYVDSNPHCPVSYYRLKQVDFDGKFEIFKVVSADLNPVLELLVYPDPVSIGESATLQIPAYNEHILQISIVDEDGQEIFSNTVEKENASDNMIRFVTEKFFKSGSYFITVSGRTNKYTKEIIVL